ncbi:MAG TPA: hypothetical protein VNO50_08085 [Pyrinomonadaceae bacterium]|nr:hypothetical protein [Pyrinomonadaceae bacterium]
MKLVWLIGAGICIVIAAVFLLLGQFNAAFVVVVLGLVSWFLNYRAQVSGHLESQYQQPNDQEGNKDENEN